MVKDCNNCRYGSYDMDSDYCNHPESFKQSMFGKSLSAMRRGIKCGPDGKLWEKRRVRVKARSTRSG